MTLTAAEVRLNGTTVARLQVVLSARGFEHFDGEFMAQDPRIGKEWLSAGEGMQVGAADADAVNADQGLARSGSRRRGVRTHKGPRLLQHDLTHGRFPLPRTAGLSLM
jgi:hypothetical protein